MAPGSFVRLGFYFLRQLILRLFRRGGGLARFEANYASDRLLPVPQEDRAMLDTFGGCIACGMCDVFFPAYGATPRGDLRAASDLPISYSRSLPDYDALGRALGRLKQADLERLERICPTSVPFRRLAAFVESQGAELTARREGGADVSSSVRAREPARETSR